MKYEKEIGAIKQCEMNMVRNAWDIGKHLKNIEDQGGNVTAVIKANFKFSPGRGLAFKRFYEESVANPTLDIKSLGVDKTLALIEPLKSDSGDFLLEHPVEELKRMKVSEVRGVARDFVDRSQPVLVKNKHVDFFVSVEEELRGVLGRFQGIHLKYGEEFKEWGGVERSRKLLGQIDMVLEDL